MSIVSPGYRPSALEVHNGPWVGRARHRSNKDKMLVSLLGALPHSIEFRGIKQHARDHDLLSWQHANCDGLSRLPQPQAPADKPDEVEMFHTTPVEVLPVTE